MTMTIFFPEISRLLAVIVLVQMVFLSPCSGEDVNGFIEQGKMLADLGRFSEAELTFRKAVQTGPKIPEGHYWLGCALFSLGKIDEAEKCFNRALELKPDYVDALIRCGSVFGSKRKWAKAEEFARKALGYDSQNSEAQLILGKVLLGKGTPAEAIPFLEKVLEKKPEKAKIYNDLGCAFSGVKNFEKAREIFEKGLKIEPKNPSLNLNLALALQDGGKKEEALRQFGKAIALSPDNSSLRLEYGKCLASAGKHPEAKAQLDVLSRLGNSSETRELESFLKGMGTSGAEPSAASSPSAPDEPLNPDIGEEEYDLLLKKVEASPEDAHQQYLFGHAALNKNLLVEAVEAFKKVVGLKPTSAAARCSLALATARLAWDQTPRFGADPEAAYDPLYDEAESLYRKALELEPGMYKATIGITMIFVETKREKQARDLLEKLLKEKPQAPLVRFHLARFSLKENNEAAAMKLLEEEVKINPDDPDVLCLQGGIFLEKGDFPESLKAFQTVASKNPGRGKYLWENIKRKFPDWKDKLQKADPEKYLSFLELAARGKDPEAIGLLASRKMQSGTPTDQEDALKTLREMAKTGATEARTRLAEQLIALDRSPQDLLEAAELFLVYSRGPRPEGNNCEKALKKFMEKKGDVNSTGPEGKSPLEIAILSENADMVQEFLKKGANPNGKTKNGMPILPMATTKKVLETLIKGGADVKANDQGGLTILALLTNHEKNPLEEVRYLLEAGVDANFRSKDGRIFLKVPVQNGVIDMVKLLIEKGADINGTDEFGTLLLSIALSNQTSGVAELLIEKGVDVKAKTKYGTTALHSAIQNDCPEKLVKSLIERGADVKSADQSGNTCLHFVVGKNMQLAELLLEKGCDVNAPDKYGRTPLHLAAQLRNADSIKFLTARGGKLDAKDNQGKTPFDRAKEIPSTTEEILILLKSPQ